MTHQRTPETPVAAPQPLAARCGGAVLGTTLHVLLLLLVLGQVVYLASRYRVRVDATADQMYSLTDSTRQIVRGLDKRLVIEAYLSPKEDLPAQFRDTRTVLENFLDELVQLGRGAIVVQRFNPIDDKTIQDKCTRIGVKPIDAQTQSTSAMSVQRHWQGLRLLYGGGRQKVIEQIAPQSSFLAEAILTPAIKEVVTEGRRRIGYMEWPSQISGGQGGSQAIGWNAVRTIDDVAKRYEFQNYLDPEGALIPDDIGTLMLFRPKDLTDRQKYQIDQFLMRGGTVVLFADVADYALAPKRQCSKVPLAFDAAGSATKWKDQLWNYGVDLSGRIVADLAQQAYQARNPLTGGWEYFGIPMQGGQQFAQQATYPYFFHAVDGDWAQVADKLASMGGRLDQEQADYWKRTLRPGIDSDEFLFKAFKQLKRGPGFYWPCALDLRRGASDVELPAGVEARTLLWTSPLTIVEDPPASLNPLQGADLRSQFLANQAFAQKLMQRIQSEPRKQLPLMLDLRGAFPSFFAGKERPKRASEIAEEEAQKKAAEAKDETKDPAATDVGPQPAEKADKPAPVVPEAEPLLAATAAKPGRLLVLADSDFLRDDFVSGAYMQLGGPRSLLGAVFFLQMLDWLSQDSDLVALQSRFPTDRKLELIEALPDRGEDQRDTEKRLKNTTVFLVTSNVLVPASVLLLLGLGVSTFRRAQKKAFLERIGN